MSAGRRGFTLLELLAVLSLTSVVLWVAVDFYLDVSGASNAAAEKTREGRRAAAILDRVAGDLASAVLVVKPPEVDPLAHPWVFYAESRDQSLGADRLKFVTRNHRPRSSAVHESDLAVVSYALRRGAGDDWELLRASTPRLPEALDREIPADEDDGALLLASGLARFGVRFLREDGEWASTWDSSTLVDSSKLPLGAEVEVAIASEAGSKAEPEAYLRRVLLPIRPLDLEKLLHGEKAGGGEEEDEEAAEDEDCRKVSECVDSALLGADAGSVVESLGGFCFDERREEIAGMVPAEAILCE